MDDGAALTRGPRGARCAERGSRAGPLNDALELGARVGALAAIEAALGGARIVRLVGSGGMGRVYLAEAKSRRPHLFAVKVMHPELARSREARRRFLREAEAARRVTHPGVVRLLDARMVEMQGGPMPVLSMQMVHGRTLRADIDARGPLREEECRRIAIEAARALAAVHEAGIVHRDVKPGNVMRTRGGAVKLLDLGVSRLADAATRLTRTGRFVGTLDYAAPEQFDRSFGPLDGRADLYALGATLFEAATGRLAWTLDEGAATRPRPSDFRPDVDPAFDEIVARLLRTNVEERPESAESVASFLEARPPRRRVRRSRAPRLVDVAGVRRATLSLFIGRAREASGLLEREAQAAAAARRLVLRGSYARGRDGLFDAVRALLPVDASRRAADWPAEARVFGVLDCLRRATGAGPVALLLDRLDCAGPESLAAFASLLSEVRGLPVTIAATWRSKDDGGIPEWLVGAAHVVRAPSRRGRGASRRRK